jgi:hypothetical protein
MTDKITAVAPMGRPKTILIIEDTPNTFRWIKGIIRRHFPNIKENDIVWAKNHEEIHEKMHENYWWIISDKVIPGSKPGYQTLADVASEMGLKRYKLIAYTSDGFDDEEIEDLKKEFPQCRAWLDKITNDYAFEKRLIEEMKKEDSSKIEDRIHNITAVAKSFGKEYLKKPLLLASNLRTSFTAFEGLPSNIDNATVQAGLDLLHGDDANSDLKYEIIKILDSMEFDERMHRKKKNPELLNN